MPASRKSIRSPRLSRPVVHRSVDYPWTTGRGFSLSPLATWRHLFHSSPLLPVAPRERPPLVPGRVSLTPVSVVATRGDDTGDTGDNPPGGDA